MKDLIPTPLSWGSPLYQN